MSLQDVDLFKITSVLWSGSGGVVRTNVAWKVLYRYWKGGVVLWKLNLMEWIKKTKLTSKSVRSRNQGLCVVVWVDVWECGVGIWCMVGLLGRCCRGMERGCVGVRNLKGVVKSSGGVVGLSIERWG